MATYPTFQYGISYAEFEQEPDSGFIWDFAEDGTIWGRSFYVTTKYAFQFGHGFLSDAERDILIAFWDTNKGLPVDLPIRGNIYSVKLLNEPKFTPLPGGWRAKVIARSA